MCAFARRLVRAVRPVERDGWRRRPAGERHVSRHGVLGVSGALT